MTQPDQPSYTALRREFLYGLGASLGSVALTSLLHAESAEPDTPVTNRPHFPAKAKHCIFLMMEGGPSHIDTFDPKPELSRRHLEEFTRSGEQQSAMSSGKRYFVKSPFEFIKAGQSGADICAHGSNSRIASTIFVSTAGRRPNP